MGDLLRRNVGRFRQPRGVLGFDLVSEGCALAVRDGWYPGRCRPTTRRHRGEVRRCIEPLICKISLDDRTIMIPVRNASEEPRWAFWKQGLKDRRHGVGEP